MPQPPDGVIDGTQHLYAVRVYYEDTDLSGIVYHANYLRWFERARSDMLRLLGVDQRAAKEVGLGVYSVAELNIRYRAPARLDDAVTIRSTTLDVRAATCRIAQQAWRGDRLLADAGVRVAFVAPGGKPRRQPSDWLDKFRSVLAKPMEVPVIT